MSSSINLKENLSIRLIIKMYEFWFDIILSILCIKIRAYYNIILSGKRLLKLYTIVLRLITFTTYVFTIGLIEDYTFYVSYVSTIKTG